MKNRTKKASCRCGAIEFEVTGKPLLTMACHCTSCQKMTASAYSLSTLYMADQFKLTKGAPVRGGLKQKLNHMCCPDCLSWLYTEIDEMGGMVNVRSAMLENASDSAPFIESYTSEMLSFAQTGAKYRFEKFPGPDDYVKLIEEFQRACDDPRRAEMGRERV